MAIGDSAPRDYVVNEFIRRTLGMHGRRPQGYGGGEICGIDNMKQWHNLKRPWIRLVSNAVPHEHAEKSPEYKTAQEIYNEDPSDTTRFRHVMWGGTGQYDQAEKRVNLGHDFSEIYVNPFQVGVDDTEKKPQLKRNYKPMPGITNASVRYSGELGALKKATINFKCYTLQDLERLERFYMYPGIKLLLEWGWSLNTADEDQDRLSRPVQLMELDTEKLKDPGLVYNHIQKQRYISGGCYDGMFGSVVNFKWSVDEDLSFNCSTDIMDYGDSIFTIAVNTPFKAGSSDFNSKDGLTLLRCLEDIEKSFGKSSVGKNNQITEEQVKLDQIGTFKAKIFKIKSGTTSKATSDKNKTEREKMLYIRFGDIVDVLLNRLYGLTSDSTRAGGTDTAPIALFSIGGSETDRGAGLSNGTIEEIPDPSDETGEKILAKRPVSIIANHKGLVSCNPGVCLIPNQIGEDPYEVVGKANEAYGTSRYVPTGLKGEGCDFNVPTSVADVLYGKGEYKREGENGAGFLANIFVNFKILLDHAETAGSVQDFLSSVTTDINKACGSLWMFAWRMLDEYPGYMTCEDRSFTWNGKVNALELAVDSQSSLVKALSMQSSVSNQTKNALFIAANGPFTGQDVKIGELHNKKIIPIQCDFAIDGISGLQYGSAFSIDYMPKRYQDQTYLFANGINHTIDETSWETNVTCQFRWAPLEDTLAKIRLKNIVNPEKTHVAVSTTDAIRNMITEDNEVQEDGNTPEKAYGNEKFYPHSIFRSAEAKDLIMGGQDGDPELGMPVDKVTETQEAKEDQVETLSQRLAKTYTLGSTPATVMENLAILRDIMMKVPEEGGAAKPAESKPANESPKKKVVKPKKVKTDFTKIQGSATYDGGTDVTKPVRPTFKGNLPPGAPPPPPSQTFIGPA